ncbi:hypothetical protein B0H13DRAFT_2320091 [Mycena leptocephala]|nr:hypothetical protein B0H13DRAFT_2320091 [Mycena leptocephala]
MSSRSAPAAFSPSRRWTRSTVLDAGTPLVSPLAPLPAEVLDRTRKGTFGPEDPHPREGTIGKDLTVRPGSIVSPQTLYTGKERRGNVHNPETGEPGAVNGHAGVQFYAAPANERVWNMEVPYVTDAQISNELTQYGKGVHREESGSSDESVVSDGWRLTPPMESPQPHLLHEFMEEMEDRMASEAGLHAIDVDDTGPVVCLGTRLSQPQLFPRRQTPEPYTDEEALEGDVPVASELWAPTPDAWTPQNPMPLERWDLSQGKVERIQYDARSRDWWRPTDENRLPNGALSTIDKSNEDDPVSSSSEDEEGEIKRYASLREDALPPGPNQPSHVDRLELPRLRSLRHGALVSRKRYSSSPSVAPSESTVDHAIYDDPLDSTRLSTPNARLVEAEKIINNVVQSAALGTANPALRPRAESFFDLPLEGETSNSPDPLFHFETDSDSLPELVEGSSSESNDSSELDRIDLEGAIEVRTRDCVDAINRMRRSALSPDLDPLQRSMTHTNLLEWGRQQDALLDRLRDDENRHAVFPLLQGLDVVKQYLGDLVDKAAMVVESDGTLIMNEPSPISAKQALVAVSGDGKRLRRMNDSVWGYTPARRIAMQAEVARLHPYLGPLIDVRGSFVDFMGRALALVTRRRYRLDLTNVNQDFVNSLPFLNQEEAGRLYVLRNVFDNKGQSEVVQAINAFLALRFRDAHVIAHLLHSDILGLEDYGSTCGGMITRADSIFSTASAFERACFNQRYPSPALFFACHSHQPGLLIQAVDGLLDPRPWLSACCVEEVLWDALHPFKFMMILAVICLGLRCVALFPYHLLRDDGSDEYS